MNPPLPIQPSSVPIELQSTTASMALVSQPKPICLIPRVVRNLPEIDTASVLIADSNLVAPQELVDGLLHAGTKAVLASCSKGGKSWILGDLAESVATGTPFLKWKTTKGKVLFINFEIHRAFIKARLQAIKERKQLTNLDNLKVWNLRGKGSDFEELLEAIIHETRGERYSLIILDPIYKAMAGRSENMAGGVGALCDKIEQLVEKTGAAVIYAHHFTKGNQSKKTPMDRMSGSGVFARDADTIITLTEHQEEGCYVVEMILRNFPPQPAFVVEWDFPLMVVRPDLDPKDLKREEGEADDDLEPLVELLDAKPLATGDWKKAAEAAGFSRPTFFRKKLRLEEGKRVEFDRKEKTWARAGAVGVAGADPIPETPAPVQTVLPVETSDTFETSETAETKTPVLPDHEGIAADEVPSSNNPIV